MNDWCMIECMIECMIDRKDCLNYLMNEWLNVRYNEWLGEWLNKWLNVWLNIRYVWYMNDWMHDCIIINRSMIKWIIECMIEYDILKS